MSCRFHRTWNILAHALSLFLLTNTFQNTSSQKCFGVNAPLTILVLLLFFLDGTHPNEEYMKSGRKPYANGFTSHCCNHTATCSSEFHVTHHTDTGYHIAIGKPELIFSTVTLILSSTYSLMTLAH
jgi:hypothetical protein